MPTYDYRCKDCGHEFEIHQSFSDDALTECPTCKGELRKVFSAVGISFKGSGFYKTDSRGSSSGGPSGGSSSSAKGETKSDTKSSDSTSSGSSAGSGSSDSGSSGSNSSGSGSTSASTTST